MAYGKRFRARGKEFLTVDHLKDDLEYLYNQNGYSFYDGELYIPGAPFETIQSLATSFTKGTANELQYHTFICGDRKGFLNTDADRFSISKDSYGNVVALEQKIIPHDVIYDKLEDAFAEGYEGIMLRDTDKIYDFKRSDALLKLKKGKTDDSVERIDDCLVKDMEVGDFPVVEDGKLVYKNLLLRLIVEQNNGKECKVGSGFSVKFRERVTNNPETIVGKVVEIENQGLGSRGLMRFPRFKRIREDIIWNE